MKDYALAAIAATCEGFLFPSETDAPVTPLRWPDMPELTEAALLGHEGLPPDTPTGTVAFDTFFDAYDPAQADPAQRETLGRIQALRAALASALTALTVFWAGRVDVDVYVLGRTLEGDVAGVRTRVVET